MGLGRRTWNTLTRRRRDRETQAELADYLAREAEQSSPRAAAARLGNAERWREEAAEARGLPRLETIARELRMALRGLRRAPGLAVAAILMLGLGLGATSAAFALVDRVLLQPLPYPQANQLVKMTLDAPGMGISQLLMGPSDFLVFRDQNRTFSAMGLYQNSPVTVTGRGEPEKVPGMAVTAGTLEAFGVRPALGRDFARADEAAGAAHVAILSHAYWQSRFGGALTALGASLTVDGAATTVVGVMPEGFSILDRNNVALYEPLTLDPAHIFLGNFSRKAVGRMRPGVTLEAASADLARLLPTVLRSFPPPPGYSIATFEAARMQPHLLPLKATIVGDAGALLWMLLAALGLVLVIVCANTANLLLVRAEGRGHELAIRASLGAGRARLAGLMLAEGFWLGALGGLLGLGVAALGLHALVAAAPQGLARISEVRLDGWTVAFTLGMGLLSGLVLAIAPALHAQRPLGRRGMREGTRGASTNRARLRTRNTLVVAQVALACVLLAAVGLMWRSARALARVAPGFDLSQPIATFHLAFNSAAYPTPQSSFQAQRRVVEALAAVPGVTAAGLSSSLPLGPDGTSDPVFVQGREQPGRKLPPLRSFHYISPGYFTAMGIPLLAGRTMTWDDAAQMRPVAVVSAAFAHEYWATPSEAVGQRIRASAADDWREIVGVAGDVHEAGMSQPPPTVVYWPLLASKLDGAPVNWPVVAGVVRSRRVGTAGFEAALRRAVWSVDRNLPLARPSTMGALYEGSMAQTRFTMSVLALAAGMGLLVGLVGLYGVLAYAVTQRRRELGVRLALGAAPASLLRAVVRQGLALALAGSALGLIGAVFASRLLAAFLYGVRPGDPATLGVVAVAMLLVAALASLLPAATAARISPVEALRGE